ncbi:EamA family transporter [Candidatus Gottesmanbacteria bacterium]|nr:EamA family transporter [Candidatus Gottesmanbacteria bacterium]
MPSWIILTIISTIFFSFYQALAKLIPKNIPVFLAASYAFFFGSMVLVVIHLLTSANKSILINEKNIPLLIGVGALVSIGNFFLIKAYSVGAPQSGFVAIFNPASVTFGVLLGLILWQEKLTLGQIAGIFFSIIGILLIISFKK